MKININLALKPLEIGFHKVHISHIQEGSCNGIDFFICKFENEDGYSFKTFSLNECGVWKIKELFTAIGMNIDELDTKDLLNKSLTIEIGIRKFVNKGIHYEKVIAINYLPFNNYNDDVNHYDDWGEWNWGDSYGVAEEYRGLTKEEYDYVITHE